MMHVLRARRAAPQVAAQPRKECGQQQREQAQAEADVVAGRGARLGTGSWSLTGLLDLSRNDQSAQVRLPEGEAWWHPSRE
jgi:hypothetical protein